MIKRTMTIAAMVMASSMAVAQPFTAEQKTEMEKIVADYILNNPETIIKSLENMQQKMIEEKKQAAKKALKENKAKFEGGDLFLGNKDGKVVIVKFFDYNCGYCRAMSETFIKKLKTDKDIKLVLRELPSLSTESVEVSKLAIAAAKQGKYAEFHEALMTSKDQATKENALKIAKELKLDIAKLEKDSQDPSVMTILTENRDLAKMIESQAVPTIILGEQVVMGAISEADLDKAIAEMKK